MGGKVIKIGRFDGLVFQTKQHWSKTLRGISSE